MSQEDLQIRSQYSHPPFYISRHFTFLLYFFLFILLLSLPFFLIFSPFIFTFFLTNISCSTPEILDDVMVVIFLYLINSDKVLNKFFFRYLLNVAKILMLIKRM